MRSKKGRGAGDDDDGLFLAVCVGWIDARIVRRCTSQIGYACLCLLGSFDQSIKTPAKKGRGIDPIRPKLAGRALMDRPSPTAHVSESNTPRSE